MSFLSNVLCSISIIIAAAIGAWRFGDIHPSFRPFIYCVWLALINESLSIGLIVAGHSNILNSNVYILLEAGLIVWQFYNWGILRTHKILFPGLLALLAAGWLIENFMIAHITQFSSWFRIFYSFIIVLLSINLLNQHIVVEKEMLLKNPVALICLAFIIYYTYKVLVETFWVYGLNESPNFQSKVYFILNYVNLFANLIYALAVLWMPTKHRFTLS